MAGIFEGVRKMLKVASEQAEHGPHNLEIEQSLLGAILLNGESMEAVISFLRPEHFFAPEHARIYELCEVLFERDRTVSPLTVSAYLSESEAESWNAIGGRSYLARLAAIGGLVGSIRETSRDVIEYWRRRQMLAAIEESIPAIGNIAVPFDEVVDYIEDVSGDMRMEGSSRPSRVSIARAAANAMESAEDASQRVDGLRGSSTGILDLDRKLGGMDAGQMIVIAGRPSMGKTTLALGIARRVAMQGRGVLYGSIEMTAEQLAYRILSDQAFDMGYVIPYDDIKRGRLDLVNRPALADARSRLSDLPLEIDESSEISMPGFRATCRKAARNFERKGTPLGLIVLDHMGLVSAPRIDNMVARMTYISGEMKKLAKHFGVPVLALSQLSRQVESRDDKRPVLSDLRESGAIEQDADVVIFTYRHEYYMSRSKPEKFKTDAAAADWHADLHACHNAADLIVAKNRQGPTGSVKTFCDITCGVFRDMGHQV
jgi:replicative DNA helicase